MATPSLMKDNVRSEVKQMNDLFSEVMNDVEQILSKSNAIIAAIDNVKDLLSKLPDEVFSPIAKIAAMDDVKNLVSKRRKEIEDKSILLLLSKLNAIIAAIDNVKNLVSELTDQEFSRNAIIAAMDDVKNLMSKRRKEIEKKSISSKNKPRQEELDKPHPLLLMEKEELDPNVKLKARYGKLTYQLRNCLLYLSIFPENEVIKKRPIIYWWIANGLIKPVGDKTAEEIGEDVFEKLLQQFDLIMPCNKGSIPNLNKCRIHPSVHHMLIKFAIEANLFDFDCRGFFDTFGISGRASCLQRGDDHWIQLDPTSARRDLETIFNVGEEYLFLDHTWIADCKNLVALLLGSCKESRLHHIVVKGSDFLSEVLRSLKLLKYLSLRGISSIAELPESVLELTNLEILDLKACHDLETLPDDISALRKLTHLNVSDCYSLEGMPNGLGKLTSLQALKGFIVSESRRSPTRIGDLKSLKNLKRFSIRIGNEAEIQAGEFERLEELEAVQRLKISWSLVSAIKNERVKNERFKFPPSLEKLVLEGLPYEKLPRWLQPSKLKGVKKLYIKGGHLMDLAHDESGDEEWKVEILRLWYMKSWRINEYTAEKWFPCLRYKEINYAKGYRNQEI